MLKHLYNLARGVVHEVGKKVARSPKWPAVEKAKLKAVPACEACTSTARLQVHHVKPFHLNPADELDPANHIVLCMGPLECHLLLGHGDSFKQYVPDVREKAAAALADPTKLPDIQAQAKACRLPNVPETAS